MNKNPQIRIQLVHDTWNPICSAVRFETRSWANHAEYVNLTDGVTLGARPKGGIQLRPINIDRHYTRVEQFTCANITAAYEWGLTQIGKPYDYGAIFGIPSVEINSITPRDLLLSRGLYWLPILGYPQLLSKPQTVIW
jgi:hypothetical protein